jgi:hypothetical protein
LAIRVRRVHDELAVLHDQLALSDDLALVAEGVWFGPGVLHDDRLALVLEHEGAMHLLALDALVDGPGLDEAVHLHVPALPGRARRRDLVDHLVRAGVARRRMEEEPDDAEPDGGGEDDLRDGGVVRGHDGLPGLAQSARCSRYRLDRGGDRVQSAT